MPTAAKVQKKGFLSWLWNIIRLASLCKLNLTLLATYRPSQKVTTSTKISN